MADQKVVLITGASSGIGYAAALTFARQGYQVAGTARRADKLAALAAAVAALPAGHGDFLPLTVDVRDAAAVQAAVGQTVSRFGRIDVLVANAGIGQRGAVVDADWEDLDTLLRTNIDGVLHSIRAAVPVMREAGRDAGRGGHVVLISSVTFNLTSPYAATYAASKAFVSSLAKSLRFELQGDQIQVIDMRIGRTVTEFNQRRLGEGQRRNTGSVSGAARRLRLPEMTADQVAQGILDAVQHNRHTVTLRWIDRLLILANRFIPGVIGRLAMRQYH